MNSKLLPLALIACIGIAAPVLGATSMYNDGVADYQNGRYQQAVVKLAKATGAEPKNAVAHYYLANALVKCADHQQAAEEYRASLMLDPTGSVSVFCRAALKGYNKPLPTEQEAQSYRGTVGGASAVRQSLSQIRKQLDDQRHNTDDYTNKYGKEAINRGNYDAGKVDTWANGEIENLHSPTRHVRDPRLLDEEYVKQREAAIRLSAKDETERIRREASETAARYRRNGEQRQKLLDESARELERQMTEKPGNSSVRLVAQGTDLYVRRYVSIKPPHPIPDARAAVVRIYGRGASSTDQSAAPSPDTHARVVRGRILN
jgi:tetratricopeptide (TPR) repeat protein